jgi:uncharacterized protein YoxC
MDIQSSNHPNPPIGNITWCDLIWALWSPTPSDVIFADPKYRDFDDRSKNQLKPILDDSSTFYLWMKIVWYVKKFEEHVKNKNHYRGYAAPKLIHAMSEVSDNDRLDTIVWYMKKLGEHVKDKNHYRIFFAHELIHPMSEVSDNDRLDTIVWYVKKLGKNVKDKNNYRAHVAPKLINEMNQNLEKSYTIWEYIVELEEHVKDKNYYRVLAAPALIHAMSEVSDNDRLDTIVWYVKKLGKNVKDKNNYRAHVAPKLINEMNQNLEKSYTIWEYIVELEEHVKDKNYYRVLAAPKLIHAMSEVSDNDRLDTMVWYVKKLEEHVKDQNHYRESTAPKLIQNASVLYFDHIDGYFDIYRQYISDKTKSKHLLLDIKWHKNNTKEDNTTWRWYTNLLMKMWHRHDRSQCPSQIKYIHDLQQLWCEYILQDLSTIFCYIADDHQLHCDLLAEHIDDNLMWALSQNSQNKLKKDISSYINVSQNQNNADHTHPHLSDKFHKLQKKLFDAWWKLLDHRLAEHISRQCPWHTDKVQKILWSDHRDEFVDIYSMSIRTEKNKTQASNIINQIISDQTCPDVSMEDSAIYLDPKNQAFLSQLSLYQKSSWIYPSSQTYQIDLTSSWSDDPNIINISHHLSDSIKQLETIHQIWSTNLPQTITTIKVQLGNEELKHTMDSLKVIYTQINNIVSRLEYKLLAQSYDLTLQSAYTDMIWQLHSINKIYSQTTKKNITSITISKENNPLRISQMGNRVEWSCLASDRENYYSVFANISDINKAVYYITDQNQQVIGRYIMAIDDDLKLMRFHIYTVSGIPVDLTPYVDDYIKNIFGDVFDFGWKEEKVSNLVCDARYHDGVREIR